MNADTFMQEFGHLADAPDGVRKLRAMVLQLAVQGKLVAQDANEQAAVTLLRDIECERDRLVAEKKTRRAKPLPPIEDESPPFGLPSSWEAAHLDTVCSLVTDGEHKTPDRIAGGSIPMATAKNIRDGHLDLTDTDFVALETAERCWKRCRPKKNDVLMVCVGATTGRLCVLRKPPPFVIVRSVALFRPFADQYEPDFLAIVLRSPFGQTQVWSGVKQSAQPCLYISRSKAIQVPVPPLAEQHRIVAKVDELMALCDELKVQQQKRRTVHVQLNNAALDRLTSAENETYFKTAWTRVRSNFDLLYSVPENVNSLRQAILQLAVQGKLLPQDHTDDPASDILARKYDLPEGNGRKRKILKKTQINVPDGLLTPLPGSWEYVSIQQLYDGNIVINYADGNHGSLYPRKSEFGDEGVLYVTARDISEGRVNWPECPHLKQSKAKELTKGWAKGGDVLLTHNATVGRVGRVEPEVGDFLLGTSVTFYRLNTTVLDADFFYFVLNSPVWQRQLEAVMKQTTRNQVSIQKQAFFQIPFPPPSEQIRIAARLDEYMTLCDDLEANLTRKQTDADRLTEAMVAAILDGAAV